MQPHIIRIQPLPVKFHRQNLSARPAEILVDGSKFSVIRKREGYEDLISLEK
jgi:hypothetical protein